jgi:hypothetical protein
MIMTFQLYNPQQVPFVVPDPPRSHFDIERLEIMRAVNEARRLARIERREVKRLRRDVRRLDRMSATRRRRSLRLPLPVRDQDQLSEVDHSQH